MNELLWLVTGAVIGAVIGAVATKAVDVGWSRMPDVRARWRRWRCSRGRHQFGGYSKLTRDGLVPYEMCMWCHELPDNE